LTTAREEFEARKLEAKYGVVGRVAAGYRRAGFDVREVEEGDPGFFRAVKRKQSLTVAVTYRQGRIGPDLAEAVADKARERGDKPVLVLYGSGPKVTGELLEKARELGVSVRRVRS